MVGRVQVVRTACMAQDWSEVNDEKTSRCMVWLTEFRGDCGLLLIGSSS